MKSFITALLISFVPFMVLIGQSETGKTDIQLHGFVRLNATVDFQDLGNSDLFRPAQIKIPGNPLDAPHLFMSAKQSRFGIKATRKINGEVLKTRIEVDFHNTSSQSGGLIRLRHAYMQYKGFTIGQAWTTFYDIQARPNIVNLEGANGSTLNRAPLIRYDHPWKGHILSIALENPVQQLTLKEEMATQKQLMPDVVAAAKFRWNDNRNFTKIAVLGRQLRYEVPDDSAVGLMHSETLYGGGAMIVGRIKGESGDQLKYELVGGKGIARYIRGVRSLGYDAICQENCQDLSGINVIGGFMAYEHQWTDKWSSTVLLGGVDVEKVDLFTEDDMDFCLYGSVNLYYQPVAPFSVGIEYLYGERVNLSGIRGTAQRIHMGAMMRF